VNNAKETANWFAHRAQPGDSFDEKAFEKMKEFFSDPDEIVESIFEDISPVLLVLDEAIAWSYVEFLVVWSFHFQPFHVPRYTILGRRQ